MNKSRKVGIMTILPKEELQSVLMAFGIDKNQKPDRKERGERYWFAELKNNENDVMKIIITCIGLSGNTECQLPVERMMDLFDPELIILSGIACGIRKFNLGDVVTSDSIWGYEYLKTKEKGQNLNRSRAKITPRFIQDDILFFNDMIDWHTLFGQLQLQLESIDKPRTPLTEPKLHRSKWIASGEKVMGAGELTKLNNYHDLISAGEMEGYGFATACEDRRPPVPWVVVRGISDHGDKDKDNKDEDDTKKPLKDEYHFSAANSAASFVKSFLVNTYSVQSQKEVISELNGDIVAIYQSILDPKFLENLYKNLRKAKQNIFFAGMGLSILKKNSEIIRLIAEALYNIDDLKFDVFYCDPNNKGLCCRVEEECSANKDNRHYREDWPTIYLDSIQKKIRSEVHPKCIDRVAFNLTNFLPTFSLIKIDNSYFFSPYGTPNVLGPDSPWLLFEKNQKNLNIMTFFDKCINSFYKNISQVVL